MRFLYSLWIALTYGAKVFVCKECGKGSDEVGFTHKGKFGPNKPMCELCLGLKTNAERSAAGREGGLKGSALDKSVAGQTGSREAKARAGHEGGRKGSAMVKSVAGQTGSREAKAHAGRKGCAMVKSVAGQTGSREAKARAGQEGGGKGCAMVKSVAGQSGSREAKADAGRIGGVSGSHEAKVGAGRTAHARRNWESVGDEHLLNEVKKHRSQCRKRRDRLYTDPFSHSAAFMRDFKARASSTMYASLPICKLKERRKRWKEKVRLAVRRWNFQKRLRKDSGDGESEKSKKDELPNERHSWELAGYVYRKDGSRHCSEGVCGICLQVKRTSSLKDARKIWRVHKGSTESVAEDERKMLESFAEQFAARYREDKPANMAYVMHGWLKDRWVCTLCLEKEKKGSRNEFSWRRLGVCSNSGPLRDLKFSERKVLARYSCAATLELRRDYTTFGLRGCCVISPRKKLTALSILEQAEGTHCATAYLDVSQGDREIKVIPYEVRVQKLKECMQSDLPDD